MRRISAVAVVVATLSTLAVLPPACVAATSGINLYWNDCSPASGGTGVTDRAFDCLSNTGPNVMFGSFSPPAPLSDLVGVSAVIDLVTSESPLPAWWSMQTGGCRAGACTASFDFTGGPFSCDDVWAGQASGGMDYQAPPYYYGNPNAARIRVVGAVPEGHPMLADGTEHYAFKVTITNVKSTGAGACAGCSARACIVFTMMQLVQPAGLGDYRLNSALSNTWITWQGVGVDCLQVPVRNRTWGELKSLYRR